MSKHGSSRTLVPSLRFLEYRDAGEWEATKLGPHVNLISGVHLAPDAYAEEGDAPYFTGPTDFTNDAQAVRKWAEASSATAQADDTLITVKGSGVGQLWHLELERVVIGRQLMAARMKRGSNLFLFHLLHTQRRRLEDLSLGNLIPGLSRGDILTLDVAIPSSAEQQRIADCLGSLDDLIAAESEALVALRRHKTGLMQQLFPRPGEPRPRLRFPEFQNGREWDEKALGELIEIASGQVDPTAPPFCDMPHVSGEHILPNGGGLMELKTAKELGQTSGKYLFGPGDLLYSKIRPALNKVALPAVEGTCSADIYPIRPATNALNRIYLFYLLLADAFLNYAIRNSARSKIPKLNRAALLSFSTQLPEPAEQARIAKCLASLDALLAARAEKLATLQDHKRGLMQQLFPTPDAAEGGD